MNAGSYAAQIAAKRAELARLRQQRAAEREHRAEWDQLLTPEQQWQRTLFETRQQAHQLRGVIS